MQSVKEKLSNMASATKEHVDIYKAKAEEKATSKTEEEKESASEIRKAKEAKAKMEFHESKAEHAAGDHHDHKDHGDKAHHDGAPLHKTTVPAYPLRGYRTHKYPF